MTNGHDVNSNDVNNNGVNSNNKALQQRLWDAAAAGDCVSIRALAVNGVDVDVPNEDGYTAFNIATQHNHPEAAVVLLAARELRYVRGLGIDPDAYFDRKTGAVKTGKAA